MRSVSSRSVKFLVVHRVDLHHDGAR